MHSTGEFEILKFDECQTCLFSAAPELGPGRKMLIAIVSVGEDRPNGDDNAKLLSQAAVMADFIREFIKGYEAGGRSGDWYIGQARKILNKIDG